MNLKKRTQEKNLTS